MVDIGQQSSITNVNVTVDIGGKGGAPGDVLVSNMSQIVTGGYESVGIFAQNAGGNGGLGGSNFNVLPTSEVEGSNVNINLEVGRAGGEGAVAGKVAVVNSGTISTKEGSSTGIYAQSVGGNGGRGGTSTNAVINADLKFLGNGASTGKASEVAAENPKTFNPGSPT